MLPVEALGDFLDALNRVADYDEDLEDGVEPRADRDKEDAPQSDES